MRLVGKTRKGINAFLLSADQKRVARYDFAQAAGVPKLSAWLDGQGGGVGDGTVRGVLYDASGNLIAQGSDVTVPNGAPAQWVDLPFPDVGGVQVVLPGSYDLGLHAGPNTNVIRVYGDDPGTSGLSGTTPFTMSGNEIADSNRALGIEGDGTGYYWVTNLITNGDFETDVSGWTLFLNATLVRDNTHAKSGGYAGRLTTSGLAINEGYSMSSTARPAVRSGVTMTYSGWLWGVGGEAMNLGVDQFYIDQTYINTVANINVTLVPGWNFFSMTFVTTNPATAFVGPYLRTRASGLAQAIDVWADSLQLEYGPVANTFVPTNGAIASAIRGNPDSSFGIYESTTNIARNGAARTDTTNWAAGNYSIANLVTNSDFETNVTGWYDRGSGSTLTQGTAGARFGTKALRVTNGVGTPVASTQVSATVTPGSAYTASAWVSGTGTVTIGFNERDGADAQVGDFSSAPLTLTGAPQLIQVTRIPAAGSTKARVFLTGSAAGTLNIDGVYLELGATATGTSDGTVSRFTGDGPFNTGIEFKATYVTGWGTYLANTSPGLTPFDVTKRYTLSFWARSSSNDTSFYVQIADSSSINFVFPGGSGTNGAFTTPADGTWQKYVFTFTPLQAGVAPVIFFGGALTNVGPVTLRVTGLQLEQRSVATPYKDTPSNATATRGASTVEFPARVLDSRQSWAAFRVRMRYGSKGTTAAGATITGDPVTDLVRRVPPTEGDGLAYPDSSYGIYPARTNLILNGGAETNVSNIGATGLNTPNAFTTQPVVGAGTGLTGTFIYRVSVYAGAFESATSGSSASVTPANQDIVVTLPNTNNNDATGRKLYRSSDAGVTWKFVATIPGLGVGATYTDNVPDASLPTQALPAGNGMAVITRSTAQSKFGAASFQSVTPGAVLAEGLFASTAAGRTDAAGTNVTGSVWAMAPSGAPSVRVWTRITNSDGSITDGTATQVNLSSAWQRIIAQPVAVAVGKTGVSYNVMCRTTIAVASTYYADGFQLELTSYATPYIHTDGAAVSRLAARVQIPYVNPNGGGQMSATTGWVSMRVRMPNAPGAYSALGGNPPRLWSWGTNPGAGDGFQLYVSSSYDGKLTLQRGNGTTIQTLNTTALAWTTAGQTFTVLAYWTSTTLGISVNGGAFVTVGGSVGIPGTVPANMDFGGNPGGAVLIGDVLWVASGVGGPPSAGDATTVNGLSSNVNAINVFDFPQKPILFWGADSAGYNLTGAPFAFPALFDWGQDNNNEVLIFYDATNRAWGAARDALGVTTGRPAINSDFNSGDFVTIVAAWTATTLAISVNGGAFTTVANSNVPVLTPLTAWIGRRSFSADGWFDSDVLWAAFGNGTLVDADAAALNANGNTDPGFSTLPGAPTALWTASTTNLTISTTGQFNTDTFSDGASVTFGPSTPLDYDLSLFATTIAATPSFTLPDETDEYLARLPFLDAQRALMTNTGEVGTFSGTCGWHGTRLSSDKGALAVARSGGAFANLVGERVRVTPRGDLTRSVVVYVHNESSEIDGDLSLTRRMFSEIGQLATDSLDVKVEVLG